MVFSLAQQSKKGGRYALFLLLIVTISGCWSATEYLQLQGRTMGTFYQVTVEANPKSRLLLEQQLDAQLQRLSDTFSTYQPESEINRISDAPAGQWLTVSDDMLQVLLLAQGVFLQSQGAFDPTIRPVVDLWGFGPMQRADVVPSDEELQLALASVGFDAVTIDAEQQRIFKHQQRTFELSGVAKGYAVDQVAEWLQRQGAGNYLVNLGGDVRVAGLRRDGQPWRIAIEHPDQQQQAVYDTLKLTDTSVLTSGDYRNYFMVDGQRYSHTLSPVTGRPIDHGLASVTVLHPSAAIADAWATAFTVLGFEASQALATANHMPLMMLMRQQHEFVLYRNSLFADVMPE